MYIISVLCRLVELLVMVHDNTVPTGSVFGWTGRYPPIHLFTWSDNRNLPTRWMIIAYSPRYSMVRILFLYSRVTAHRHIFFSWMKYECTNELDTGHSVECKLTPVTRSPSTEICFCTLWHCDLDLWLFDRMFHGSAAGLYDVPRTRTLIGSRAFSDAGPKAWNSLPQSLRDTTSTATFKRHLKTHLFNNILT